MLPVSQRKVRGSIRCRQDEIEHVRAAVAAAVQSGVEDVRERTKAVLVSTAAEACSCGPGSTFRGTEGEAIERHRASEKGVQTQSVELNVGVQRDREEHLL